jgi:ABC-2 type transport system permease protein
MDKNIILLKALLKSTSSINICKHCKDKKKRGKIVGSMIGAGILYLMLMCYCVLSCIGYGHYGLTAYIPFMCSAVISLLAFIFTLFKTNGYLFGFKEYDMLMSLPFEPKTIAACKFMYMYVKSLPWYLSVSLSMLVGYGIYAKPNVIVYPLWLILSLVMPIIPMLGAAFIGFIIARLGSGFKNKTIAQTVLSIIFVCLCFGLRFFLQDMFQNNKTKDVLNSLSRTTDKASRIYLPMKWFSDAVTKPDILSALLFAAVTAVLFAVTFIPVGRSYRKINSALRSHAASGGFVMKEQKQRPLIQAIAFKEFRRMTGSVVYMTNALIGEIMCFVAGVAVLFIDPQKVLSSMTKGSPLTVEMLIPALPFIAYFFVGMVATTAFTPSLEGKNYWIVQSLPISKKTLYQGKMLFNMYLTVPFAVFATLTFSISAKASVLNTLLLIVLVICQCAFSSAWGCVCGIKHMRLDWENEVEVIKQGTAVVIYLLPNMFVTMGLTVLVVYLGTIMPPLLVTAMLIPITAVLALLSYLRAMSLAEKRG